MQLLHLSVSLIEQSSPIFMIILINGNNLEQNFKISKRLTGTCTLVRMNLVSLNLVLPQMFMFPIFIKHHRCYNLLRSALADLGGVPGALPHYETQFFHFCIHFCQKAPMSEVHAPPNGSTPPPTGNPGSATEVYHVFGICLITSGKLSCWIFQLVKLLLKIYHSKSSILLFELTSLHLRKLSRIAFPFLKYNVCCRAL